MKSSPDDGEHEAGDDTPIIHGPGSRAERDSARRLPHGGRQMSWWHQRHIHQRWKTVAGQCSDGARAGLGNKHDRNTRCTQVQGPRDTSAPLPCAPPPERLPCAPLLPRRLSCAPLRRDGSLPRIHMWQLPYLAPPLPEDGDALLRLELHPYRTVPSPLKFHDTCSKIGRAHV